MLHPHEIRKRLQVWWLRHRTVHWIFIFISKGNLNPLFVASKPSNFSDYLGNNQITHIRISQRQLGITRPSFSHLQLVNFLASFKVCKGGMGRNYMHIRKTELIRKFRWVRDIQFLLWSLTNLKRIFPIEKNTYFKEKFIDS